MALQPAPDRIGVFDRDVLLEFSGRFDREHFGSIWVGARVSSACHLLLERLRLGVSLLVSSYCASIASGLIELSWFLFLSVKHSRLCA